MGKGTVAVGTFSVAAFFAAAAFFSTAGVRPIKAAHVSGSSPDASRSLYSNSSSLE